MTPTAGTVLGLRNGGNTLMGVKPAGSRAKEAARVGLGTVGKPPPPGVPATGAPDGTDPGVEKAVIITPVSKEFYEKLILIVEIVVQDNWFKDCCSLSDVENIAALIKSPW